jgi:hypothetical protein
MKLLFHWERAPLCLASVLLLMQGSGDYSVVQDMGYYSPGSRYFSEGIRVRE